MESIEKIILKKFEKTDVRLIYLFGSYAKGNHTSDSDVDIAVLSEKKLNSDEIFNFKMELVDALGKKVDLIDLSNCNIIIAYQVVNKGKNILEKNKSERLNYEYRIAAKYLQYIDDVKVVKQKIKERGYVYGGDTTS